MDLLDRIHKAAFLGPEFLTWLWFRSEAQDGEFALDPEFGDFELWFEDRMVVSSPAINAQENLFKGGHPAGSLEARTALRLGKLASEAKLRIVRGAQEWSFVLRGGDLSVSGVKLPAVLAREDDERFYERMFLVEQLDTMLKGLFGLFLKVRLGPKWAAEELPALQAWVAGGQPEPVALDPVAMGVKAVPVKAPPADGDAPALAPRPAPAASEAGAKAEAGAEAAPAAPADEAPPWEAVDGDDDVPPWEAG